MCRTYISDELINLNNTDNEAKIDFLEFVARICKINIFSKFNNFS